MVEIGKIGGIKVDLEDFLLFSIDINDLLYGLHRDMVKQLMLFMKNVTDVGMEAKLETSKGRIIIECNGLKTLYFEDYFEDDEARYLAITRIQDVDGVNYFIAFSDTASHDYIHYLEYVDRNRESQAQLYDDISEFIYANKLELVEKWINMFRNPKILENFPEFSYIVERLEYLKDRLDVIP